MNSVQKNSGTGDGFSDWAAVVLAALLFLRTADVLAYFSPQILNDLIGSDVSWLYGGICAFFIEGVALAYHFNKRAQHHGPAQIVKWSLLAISGACQVFDGRIITGTLAEMPEAQKLVFQIGVPLLPLIVLVLLFFVGKLPDSETQGNWVGVKNIFKPAWNRFLEGDNVDQPSVISENNNNQEVVRQPLDPELARQIEEIVRKANNGNEASETKNFQ